MASPGFEEIETLTNARQLPNRRQIGCIERHAAKNRIQGVVPADDHFDGRAATLACCAVTGASRRAVVAQRKPATAAGAFGYTNGAGA